MSRIRGKAEELDFEALTSYLEEHGVSVWADAGELRYRGSKDAMTPLVLGAMARHKAKLIEYLTVAAPDSSPDARSRAEASVLSVDQESLWFRDQLYGGNPSDHLSHAVRILGDFNPSWLEQALSTVIARHEILRSTYAEGEQGPTRRVHAPETANVAIHDLSEFAADERETEARRICTSDFQRTFDLTTDSPMRTTLIRLTGHEWVLLFVVHHIAFDNLSFGIVFEELARLFASYRTGSPASLAEPPFQYAHFATWQQEQQSSDRVNKQVGYWKETLSGPDLLELPTDRPRPALQSPSGARQPLRISAELKRDLQAIGRSEGASLYMTLLAAAQGLLHRYTGQERIALGGPVSVRNRPELEGLIGLFLNVLVLQSNVTSDQTFRNLLRQARAAALGAYANQDVPFERLVSLLQPDRDLSHNPLFQVMLQLSPRQVIDLPGLALEPFDFERGTSQFDLSIHLFEVDDSLEGFIEYDTDLFDSDRIQRMVSHFETLLAGLAANPDAELASIPILTEGETQQLVDEWNQTDAAFPSETCVHRLFEDQTAREPDATALIFEDVEMSYRTLNERANQLAHRLLGLGVGPDTLVGIALERSLDMMIAVLGTLKAGGAYVPMDPSFPRDRLAFMLEDSGAAVVITRQDSAGSFLGEATAAVHLDLERAELNALSTENPASTVAPHNLAYVIYTSGSTGLPKGVMVPHRAVVNFVTSMAKTPGMSSADRIAAVTTLSFDIHVLELLQPLTLGATILLVPDETTGDGKALAQLLTDSHATMMQATPATWRLLVEEDWSGPSGFKALCGGEALPPALAAELRQRTHQLWNMYGPTETTVWSTCALLNEESRVSIGRPIDNTQLYVLDGNLNPTPIGIPGELYIGGSGVTSGYHNRAELTAERFVRNPFDPSRSSLLYRTGDLVTYRRDGMLDYRRRLDDQVKVRGFRIELGEIEATLARHPTVDQAAAVVQDDSSQEKRLVGYVAASAPAAPTVTELRSFLLETLPGYMVPSVFVILESLPLTPNGKVDKKALPAPDTSRPTLDTTYAAPQTDVEASIAGIWREVLDVETVGIHDNFFDLGGHSMLLMRLRARLEASFQQPVPLMELFKHPTVNLLARFFANGNAAGADIEGAPDRTGSPGVVPAEAGDRPQAGSMPVPPNLHRFLEERNSPDVDHWNVSALLTLPPGIDLSRLRAAAQIATDRHDALRLRLGMTDQGWRVWLTETADLIEISTHDLSTMAPGDQQSELEAVTRRLHEGFDLADGPVLHLAHFDLGSAGHRLFVVIHHFVGEGMSLGIILEELETAYHQLTRDELVNLPRPTMTVREWAERLDVIAQSTEVSRELDYWLSLPWSRAVGLPYDFDGGPADNTNASARVASVSLSSEETGALTGKRVGGLAIEEVLIASLAQAVAGRQPGAVHLERMGHGRIVPQHDIDLSRTVGFFLSYTPMVLEVPSTGEGTGSVRNIALQIREANTRGYSFDLLKWMSRDESASHAMQQLPRPQLSFNYRGRIDDWLPPESMFEVAAENDVTAHNHSPRGLRYYPISVMSDIESDVLTTRFVFSAALHSRESVQLLAERFDHHLRASIALADA